MRRWATSVYPGRVDGSPLIRLRPLAPGDADAVLDYQRRNRAHFAPFDPERDEAFFTAEATARRVAEQVAHPGRHDWLVMDGGDLVGRIAVSNIVHGAFMSANLGYSVDQARSGRGTATAAIALVVREAFGPLGLHRLEAGTLLDNVASQRVLEKNGFTRIGVAPRYLRIAGEWRDHVLFSLTAEDVAA